MKRELIKTTDGSSTLHIPEMDEHYHSVHGAVTESNHVFIQNGLNHHFIPEPVVFEVGFGTGLNALLTAFWAETENRPVFYMTIEKHVLDPDLIQKLNYGRLMGGKGEEMFSAIHACVWNRQEQITPRFKLLKINADFIGADWKLPQRYHVVYFDAFGPDKQPEMWGQDSFFRIYEGMEPGGVFVTYSAKGAVRRRLIVAGFDVQRISGPPGKKEMLRGIKLLSKVSMPKK